MPRNPSGTNYTAPNTFSPGTKAYSAQVNANFQDVGAELVNSLPRDGRAPMLGSLDMNGQRLLNLPTPTDPQEPVPLGMISDLGVDIGDGKYSLRDLSPNWLRRDGGIYDIADYPTLAALLPALPDGVNYTNRAIPSGTNVNKIINADGKFVAVCDGGRIYVTEDRGVNWDQKSSGTSENLIDIAYGNGVWCAIAQNKTTCISSDADTWTNGSVSSALASAICITFGAGKFVVGGTVSPTGYAAVSTSIDAVTWSGDKLSASAGGGAWSICYNGSMFLVGSQGSGASNVAFRSTDGDTWNSAVTGAGIAFRDIASDGSLFVMVGNGGGIWTTTNGTTFTQRTSGTTNNLFGVDWTVDGGWMAVGVGGVARISGNGTSWASTATGTASDLRTVHHDPDGPFHYLIGGASGLVLDGLRTSPTQFQVPNDGPNEWIRAV